MFKHILRIESATDADAGRLADIRVKAMQPSLQAAGRFDPERAKYRFLDSFRASETKIIYVNEKIAGFFIVQKNTDHLYLNHLYITDDFQGSGIGRQIIDGLKIEAATVSLPIRLMALIGSPANAFYQSCGFEFVSADEVDTIYQWSPE